MNIPQNTAFATPLNNFKKTLPKVYKPLVSFLALQEAESGLAHVRFFQDTMTNWVPKATFSRSKADLTESTFLEFSESTLVYYAPALLGEKVFRRLYSKQLNPDLKKKVVLSAQEIQKNVKPADAKKLLAVKSAIALACMCIPLAEYSLNYLKNLLTLKMFKQADFDNIANLNKAKKEDSAKQEKVKKSAEHHIKLAALTYAGCLAGSVLLATKGHKSKTLQNISQLILEPGTKLFDKKPKLKNFFNKYFSLDFTNANGKLALSKGQLTSCVLIGGLSYLGSAHDRGKQNFLEVLSRFPLVGFYVITGSELFEKGFKKYLYNHNHFKNLINKNLEVPKLSQVAENIAKSDSQNKNKEFLKLLKEKSIITGVPFLFSLGFMGFAVAGISNLFTKYRYNKEHSMTQNTKTEPISNNKNNDLFKKFNMAV